MKVFLADTLTATACRSLSSLISLNRTDLLMYKVTPPVALSSGELFVIPEKPVRLTILSFHSWHSCTATIWGLQSPSHVRGKTSLCDSCRAWETVEADKDHTTGTFGWSCWPVENTKAHLTKQIRKSKSCLKRNAPATIICLQNLMIKLPRLHTRLPAVHTRLSLGPCRMIGGQDLPRGHNTRLVQGTEGRM